MSEKVNDQRSKESSDDSNITGLVAVHANHHYPGARWGLGRHVEVYGTELFGILLC